MTLSRRILSGLCAGVAVGLFLGELVRPLQVVADGFVRLLQMTVLPYVTVSIIVSLGSLDAATARRLGLRVGGVVAGLWAVAIGFAFLVPVVFPPGENASFFSASLVGEPAAFDFVGLYIPSNPFHSLANNVVPAVVLFSVIVGLALIGVERKAALIDVLAVASATIARATRLVVRLTPYGIFALAAVASGTLSLEQLERIQVYLVTYVAISLLVALWVLPGLVAALTAVPYAGVLPPVRDALITAFLAGDLFIVLPLLIESSKETLARYGVVDATADGLPDVIVPASFNFPHTGKLLSISFVLFAGWFADAEVPLHDYPQLAAAGLLSFFGSLNAAVPFLLDLFRIPADTFQLFVATSVVNSRFGTLLAAVHTVTVALLGTAAVANAVVIDARRLTRYVLITCLLTLTVIVGLRVTFRTLLWEPFRGREIVYGMTTVLEHEPSVVAEAPPEPGTAGDTGPVLDAIRARGTLRVGVVEGRLPFAFRNAKGDLVGIDVELAHLLARDLGVAVVFVEFPAADLLDAVSQGRCDLGIGGQPVTPRLALDTLFSKPYLDETLAFLVRDHLRDRFGTWDGIRAIDGLVIGVPPLPYYVNALRDRLPGAALTGLGPGEDPLADGAFDVVAYTAERGAVLTMLHPAWTVVVPRPGRVDVPLAFPIGRRDEALARFVDTWIDLKRRDGTLQALRDHWILGKDLETKTRRWSIAHDVLGWGR